MCPEGFDSISNDDFHCLKGMKSMRIKEFHNIKSTGSRKDCPDGYNQIEHNICIKKCPDGWEDFGRTCKKPLIYLRENEVFYYKLDFDDI